jgi:hypothetical protein
LAIEEGIKRNDVDVLTLAAAALTYAGPDLSEALPEQNREDLIDSLHFGMDKAGGPLAAIASSYTEALRNRSDDWSSLQIGLRRTINHVRQSMDASDESDIYDSHMHVEATSETVEQVMRATGKSTIQGSSQTVGNRRSEKSA